MRNFIIISVILATLPFNTFVKHQIDSLENELRTLTKREKLKIEKRIIVLNQLVKLYRDNNPDKALSYANSALSLAIQIDDKKAIAYSMIDVAEINLLSKSNYEIALELYRKSLDICIELNDSKEISNALNGIANVYIKFGDYEKALKYSQDALKVSEKSGYKRGIISSLNNISIIYSNMDNFNEALKYDLKNLSLSKTEDIKTQAHIMNNIACAYRKIGNPQKALEYFQQSLNIFIKHNIKSSEATSLLNIGLTYFYMKDYKKALDYYQKSLVLFQRLGLKDGEVALYGNLGNIYDEYKQYNKALEYFNKCLKIAKSYKIIHAIRDSYQNLSEIYSKLNKNPEAFYNYKQYIILKDSIMSIEKQTQITNLQIRYEVEKKDLEIEKQNLELKKQQSKMEKQRFLFAIYILASIIVIFIFIYLKNKNRRKRENLEQETIRLEQKLLRLQMNPHFIFNSLMAIQSFIYKQHTENAIKYLTDFASLLRLIIENSRAEYITLDNEVKTLGYYLELQESRFKNKFEYKIHIDEDMNIDNIFIPPMLAQPFIENAIEHGILHSDRKGKIYIRFIIKEDFILFETEDNGLGMSESAKEKRKNHHSLAMTITKERLENLNHGRKRKISINISPPSTGDYGTKVSFYIPLKKI